jgi:hypothetical protein
MAARQAASGSLIAYATAPGTEAADGNGPHSPFTASLLKHIERPGLTVQQVLNAVRGDVKAVTKGRQVPWESSALEGDFYFVQASAPAARSAQTAVAAAPASDAEEMYFRSIKDSRRPEELRVFLEKFPNGNYTPLVRVWAQQGVAQPASPAPLAVPAAGKPGGTNSPGVNNAGASVPAARTGDQVSPDATEPGKKLLEALRTALPELSEPARLGLLRRFVESPPVGRAIAAHPATGARAEASKEPTNAAASAYVLDRCAYRAGRPCALIAEGSDVMAPDAAGAWPTRDPPRLNYTGLFDPARIPLVSAKDRERADLRGYLSLKGPKAATLRPDGIYVATASTQREAEIRAFDACASDPSRGDSVCHLYAAGDGVVLPRWYTAPATPATEPAAPPEVARIAAIAALSGPRAAANVRGDYAKVKEHKAIAVHPLTGFTFRWDGASTPDLAERWALEGCQLTYDGPCVLLAVDLEPRTDDPRVAKPRFMDRVGYSGPFRLDRVPVGMERSEAVRQYAQLPGERAIAVRARGALVQVVSGKATRVDAERDALARCNPPEDPSPCFLYAIGDTVVLPRRRTEATER